MVISLQENNHIQSYLDLPEPTLHKKITCACNVGPQSANNFAEENNLQFWLDLSGPTWHTMSLSLRQHCTIKLLAQCWHRALRYTFAGKPGCSFIYFW